MQKAHEEQRLRGFWWHVQRLDEGRRGLHGRVWLKHRRHRGELALEGHLPGGKHPHLEVTLGSEHQVLVSCSLWLVSLFLSLDGLSWLRTHLPRRVGPEGRTLDLSWYRGHLSWKVWTIPDEWHCTTPRWRDGFFDVPQFLLGKQSYTHEEGRVAVAVAHFPEGDYLVTLTWVQETWTRPRWPWPLHRRGIEIDAGETGVPIPGKGENSWDCGENALLSTGSSATTVEGALADFVRHVTERRERYGGLHWRPAMPAAAASSSSSEHDDQLASD